LLNRYYVLCTAQEILDALHTNRNISILELKGNTLGVNAAKAIGNALEQHSDIKVIHTASDHVYLCKSLNHIYMCVTCNLLSGNCVFRNLLDFLGCPTIVGRSYFCLLLWRNCVSLLKIYLLCYIFGGTFCLIICC